MGKVLNDLWILTESGITVYSRVLDPRINPQLFGALMSALNLFAEQLSNGGITNFELSKLRFTIIKKNNFIFIANSSNKSKEKKVLNELSRISDKFFELYPEEILEKWDNDINIFSNFENEIKDSLEETTRKF
ncbi:MAG: hypothetical protein ACFE8L_14250 [Candidatus Hodarchaeota archaeon]